MTPEDVMPIRRTVPGFAKKLPQWLRDAGGAYYRGIRHSLQFQLRGAAMEKVERSPRLATVPTKPKDRWPLEFTDMPNPSREWSQAIAAAEFVKRPSAGSLAEALETIANVWEEAGEVMHGMRWPWPLGAILEFASSNEQMRHFAQLAKKRQFGDVIDWLAAEERWHKLGVTREDFLYSCPSDVPFDDDIARVGVPHGALLLLEEAGVPDDELIRVFMSMPKGRHRGLRGGVILWSVMPHLDTSKNRISGVIEAAGGGRW